LSYLTVTELDEAGLAYASEINAGYAEIEAAVNGVDRTNLATKHTITMVTTTWEDLATKTSPETHKVMVPIFASDARAYLVGFSYNGWYFSDLAYDARMIIRRGDLTYGDRDEIFRMALYRPATTPGAISSTRDMVTEAFKSGDYVSVQLEEVNMSTPGGGTVHGFFDGTGLTQFEMHLFFAHPILEGSEL